MSKARQIPQSDLMLAAAELRDKKNALANTVAEAVDEIVAGMNVEYDYILQKNACFSGFFFLAPGVLVKATERFDPALLLITKENPFPTWLDVDANNFVYIKNKEAFLKRVGEAENLYHIGEDIYTKDNPKPLIKSQVRGIIGKYLAPIITDGVTNGVPEKDFALRSFTYDLSANVPEKLTRQVDNLQTISAAELKTMKLSPPEFVVKDLLPVGLTFFAAPPKTGKSWLALDLCTAVATGSSFMGMETKKGAVLYLDLESREWRSRDRLQKMNAPMPENLHIAYNAASIDGGLVDQLSNWIDGANTPRLIIIDTLGKVNGTSKRSENAYEASTRLLSPLHSLAQAMNVAIICITHLRKQTAAALDDPFDAIVGSSGQFGVADTGWMITGRRGEERQFIATGRDISQFTAQIEFNTDLYRWNFIGETEEVEKQRAIKQYNENPLVVTIRKLVADGAGRPVKITAQELINAMADIAGQLIADSSPRGIGVSIRKLTPDLLRQDKIVVTLPAYGGKTGRQYIFHSRNSELIQ